MHLRSVLLLFGSALLMEVSDGNEGRTKNHTLYSKQMNRLEEQRSERGSADYWMIFPQDPGTAYVKVTPKKDTNLTAFTLCVTTLTDLRRQYPIFSYSTSAGKNDLLLARKSLGKYEVHIGGNSVTFTIADSLLSTNSICIIWDSNTGVVGLWANPMKSVRKIVSRGYTIKSGGVTLLGKEQDKPKSGTDASKSFVGELYCLNLWDYVLPAQEIRTSTRGACGSSGNVIDWDSLKYVAIGYIVVL